MSEMIELVCPKCGEDVRVKRFTVEIVVCQQCSCVCEFNHECCDNGECYEYLVRIDG